MSEDQKDARIAELEQEVSDVTDDYNGAVSTSNDQQDRADALESERDTLQGKLDLIESLADSISRAI